MALGAQLMYTDVRGSLQDYDDWATIVEDEGWGADKMMNYMRKHQTLEPIADSVTDRSTMPVRDWAVCIDQICRPANSSSLSVNIMGPQAQSRLHSTTGGFQSRMISFMHAMMLLASARNPWIRGVEITLDFTIH